MQELIKIDFSKENPVVSARTLHEYLECDTDYRHWFPRMCEYGFTEGTDFNTVKIDRVQNEGNRHVTRTVDDAALSIDMAKEICMIQRNERGRQARQYFIEAEKKWRQGIPAQKTPVMPFKQSEMLLAMAQTARLAEGADEKAETALKGINLLTAAQEAMDKKLDSTVEAFTARSTEPEIWQNEIRAAVCKIAQEKKFSYQDYWNRLYDMLEERAGVNLEKRKKNQIARMQKAGATVLEVRSTSTLSIIARDKKLRSIFDDIVRTEEVKYILKGA